MSTTYERLKKLVVEQLGVEEDEVKPEASFVDDLNKVLNPVGGKAIEISPYETQLELCPGHSVIIRQMHTTEPSLARPDGSPYYYLDVDIVAPGCHDSYDGALGQTYKCKYVGGKEKFVWSHEQEESFRVPSLFTPTGAFAVDAPCRDMRAVKAIESMRGSMKHE